MRQNKGSWIRSFPFAWIDQRARGKSLMVATVLVLACTATLVLLDRSLRNDVAPHGIVSFELAGTLERSEAILQSWSEQVRSVAMLIQGFDYLYLIIYPAWLSLASIALGTLLGGRWQTAGLVTGWMVLVAAPLDAVENYALIQQLLHGAAAGLAQLSLWCASAKFALIAWALGFLLAGAGAWALRRRG